MDIVLRQNGREVGRFGLTTNDIASQTPDVIKIVKNGTTYYGLLTTDKPNTTRNLKVIKNGRTLYLQTNPGWVGTLTFTFEPTDASFQMTVFPNVLYTPGVYKVTIITIPASGDEVQTSYVENYTVEQEVRGNFSVEQYSDQGTLYQDVRFAEFGTDDIIGFQGVKILSVTVEKIV